MTDVAFLFGAGASAKVLPTVKDIPGRLEKFIKYIDSNRKDFWIIEMTDYPDKKLSEATDMLVDDLNWLLSNTKMHASIDTFAKKLFLIQDEPSLKRLKLAFSIFFIHEQADNNADNRYDAFLASIIRNHKLDFPKNVKILSWNYDFQFEKAYMEFSGKSSLSENQIILNVKEKYIRKDNIDDNFTIIKLNGTTSIYALNSGYHKLALMRELVSKKTIGDLSNLIEIFYSVRHNDDIQCSLSFAWEREAGYGGILDDAKKSLKDTEILIVIGYSFPFFNREVDRDIITAMPNLKKVYFQSLEPEAISERFESIISPGREYISVLKRDVEQFFLPNEL